MRTIRDERTGDCPSDLSREACRERVTRTRRNDCPNAPTHEVPTDPAIATLAEVTAYLRRLGGSNSKDARFAESLASYAERTGTLTEKQAHHARRLYTRWYEACLAYARSNNGKHEWREVGSITYYYSTVLGTYSASDFYKCAYCDEWGERYHENNYSGD